MKKNKFQRPKKVSGSIAGNRDLPVKDDDDVINYDQNSESNIEHRVVTNSNSLDNSLDYTNDL